MHYVTIGPSVGKHGSFAWWGYRLAIGQIAVSACNLWLASPQISNSWSSQLSGLTFPFMDCVSKSRKQDDFAMNRPRADRLGNISWYFNIEQATLLCQAPKFNQLRMKFIQDDDPILYDIICVYFMFIQLLGAKYVPFVAFNIAPLVAASPLLCRVMSRTTTRKIWATRSVGAKGSCACSLNWGPV